MAKYREVTIDEINEGDVICFQFGSRYTKGKVIDIFPDGIMVQHFDFPSKLHHQQHLNHFYYSDDDQLTKLQKIKRWLKSLCA